jgi:hypothetical protein
MAHSGRAPAPVGWRAEVLVDSLDLDLDLDLDTDDGELLPPADPPSGPSPRPPLALTGKVGGGGLLTFLIVLFGLLEAQTILVMFGAADGGSSVLATYVFGGVFMITVFSWFFIGMLWFARKWEQAQGR